MLFMFTIHDYTSLDYQRYLVRGESLANATANFSLHQSGTVAPEQTTVIKIKGGYLIAFDHQHQTVVVTATDITGHPHLPEPEGNVERLS